MKAGNRDGIKLSQLRALVAAADYGNFGEAGLQLAVSQSAVSHAIATLEDELGVVLLSRGRYGARLTPVGERVTNHAREILQLLEKIDREANLAKGLDTGQLRIATFRSVGTHILPEVIAKLRSNLPGIGITIVEYRGDELVEQALREGRADVGFTCLPTTEEFETWEFLRDEYVALLPPHLQRPNIPITWEEFATYPLIMPPDNDYCGILIQGHFMEHGQSVHAAYEIQEDSTIVGMVAQGLGITVMARLAAEPLPPEIQVCSLPVPLERVIRVAMLANALHPPIVFAFLDVLREMYQLKQQLTDLDRMALK
jgi:DNA-binding transcriptional LysR family regulator